MNQQPSLPGTPLDLDLEGSIFQGKVRYVEEAESTNDIIAEGGIQTFPEGLCIVAARQRRGRGRQGRSWESGEGGLYLSALFRPKDKTANIPQLSLVAGLAVCLSLHEAGLAEARIKWPNDIIARGLKLAGILCESRLSRESVELLICGIGVNVNQAPEKLPPGATSIKAELRRAWDVSLCAKAILTALDRWYRAWVEGASEMVMEQYRNHAVGLVGAKVLVETGMRDITGLTDGIDQDGSLIVVSEDGQRKSYVAGEITFLSPTVRAWS